MIESLLQDVELSSKTISRERIRQLIESPENEIGRCEDVRWDNGKCLRIAIRNRSLSGMHRKWSDRPGIEVLCLGDTWAPKAFDWAVSLLYQGTILPISNEESADRMFATLHSNEEAVTIYDRIEKELLDWYRGRIDIF